MLAHFQGIPVYKRPVEVKTDFDAMHEDIGSVTVSTVNQILCDFVVCVPICNYRPMRGVNNGTTYPLSSCKF